MNAVMQIELRRVKVFGFHGLDAGEDVAGGEFEVSVTASYVPAETVIKNLNKTADYTAVLALVRQRMQKPAHLLETLATEIASEIIAKFSIVTEVEISVYKLHPPIENFEGSVGVTYKLKRD